MSLYVQFNLVFDDETNMKRFGHCVGLRHSYVKIVCERAETKYMMVQFVGLNKGGIVVSTRFNAYRRNIQQYASNQLTSQFERIYVTGFSCEFCVRSLEIRMCDNYLRITTPELESWTFKAAKVSPCLVNRLAGSLVCIELNRPTKMLTHKFFDFNQGDTFEISKKVDQYTFYRLHSESSLIDSIKYYDVQPITLCVAQPGFRKTPTYQIDATVRLKYTGYLSVRIIGFLDSIIFMWYDGSQLDTVNIYRAVSAMNAVLSIRSHGPSTSCLA
jgi:hypothetical protein